jgi:hypothetical protein
MENDFKTRCSGEGGPWHCRASAAGWPFYCWFSCGGDCNCLCSTGAANEATEQELVILRGGDVDIGNDDDGAVYAPCPPSYLSCSTAMDTVVHPDDMAPALYYSSLTGCCCIGLTFLMLLPIFCNSACAAF